MADLLPPLQSAEPGRHRFIDLYRSAVILLMLEGHTVRAFLSPHLQQTPFFSIHEIFHGLSAPAFLFGSGLTFVISTRKRWKQYHQWSSPLARRIARFVLILGLGIAIHLPFFSFRKILLNGTTADDLQLFQSDVLHCISIGLLALHALVFFFKTEVRFYGLVLATTIGACFLTPLIWDIDFLHYLPLPFAQLMNSVHGSPFPLFPYVGFLFAGVIVSWEFLVSVEKKEEQRFMKKIILVGAGLLVAGIVFDAAPFSLYSTYNYWYTSPNYFFVRVGVLLILTATSWFAVKRWHPTNILWTICGKESLFIYVVHLPILYGSVINPTTYGSAMLGSRLEVLPAILVTLALVALMIAAALAWNYLKRQRFTMYRLIQLALAGWFLVELFSGDN